VSDTDGDCRSCLDAGLNFFDTADVYPSASETILGAALEVGDRVVLSTNHMRAGTVERRRRVPASYASRRIAPAATRHRHRSAQLHHFDAQTPLDSVMSTLDDLVRAGKVLYIGASNFSGWQLMKSQAVADRYGYAKYVARQVYYSLIGRDYEWELMPLGLDQGIGAVVWSPLGWGRLTGRVRRDRPTPTRRLKETSQFAPPVDDARLHRVIDALDEIAVETGKSIPQVALNWLLQRPTVSTILIGARNEEQLRDNLGAVGWSLSAAQVARLDAASALVPPYPYYPYWNGQFAERTPPPVVAA
jgi:aryl-alcohol dehydrogenase-like predicted oxidoreductase